MATSLNDQTAGTIRRVLSQVWSFFLRNRVSIQDLSVLIAVVLVTAYIAFEVDIYVTQDGVTREEQTLELDEVLTVGGVLTLGLLVFAIRRYSEQKGETRRRIAAEQQARELALQDPLTGLANRRQFDAALTAAVGALPSAGAAHALLCLDLNGFKKVNDVYGHGVGDELLTVVARRLMAAVREGDLVARLGGDEFAILALHLSGPEAATSIALRVIAALEEPIVTGSGRHQVGTGIGIALIPNDAATVQEALRKADVALYRAKMEGRSALRFFEEEMDRHVRERDHLERELRTAIFENSIEAFFQPVVDLNTGRVSAFEVVPRWFRADSGEVPRERFIPIAESLGLIHQLSDHLLTEACRAAVRWPGDVALTFYLYPSQLKNPALAERITAIMDTTNLSADKLEIEIAERALVDNLEAAQQMLGALRQIGVAITLTNFGTGYSSLYHLRNFKLDKIKIDRSFMESLGSQRESQQIVNALIGLGRGLGLSVSADGVRNLEQGASLRETGCEEGQGFVFGQPVPAEDTFTLISGHQHA